MIGTLIIGWILTLFNIDVIIVSAINQIFNTEFNVAVYWLIIAVLAIIDHIMKNI